MAHDTTPMDVNKARDAGMALCLLCFLVGAWTHQRWLEWTATGVLVVDMIAPILFKPFAIVWFGFSRTIGTVMSTVLLSLLFYLIVTPIGVVRRLMGKDPMQVRRWKRDQDTVFVVRDHLYSRKDIERPY